MASVIPTSPNLLALYPLPPAKGFRPASEPTFGLECRHATGSRSRHSLLVEIVHHVAGGEYPWNGRGRLDEAIRLESNLSVQEAGVGRVPDRDEQSTDLE